LIGWGIAHTIRMPDRQTRLWCVLAALLPDLDSAGILFGWQLYERYHHVLLHNLVFGAVVTALAARWVGARPVPLLLVFASFVSHLVGDYFGSGAGWGIMPFPPFSNAEYVYTMIPRDVLVPGVVGNVGAAMLLIVIAVRAGRTPLEFIHADAERFLVDAIRLRISRTPCGTCDARASFRCVRCASAVCHTHVARGFTLRPRCAGCAT
jgi:LexA-binding, inner membrane-associated putative hydrolase